MNRWLQSKIYECPQCPASYRHDEAYFHALFGCQNRVSKQTSSAAMPLLTGGVPVLVGADRHAPVPAPKISRKVPNHITRRPV